MLHNIVIKQRKVYLPNRNFVQGGINSDEVAVFPDLEWENCDTLLITMKNENVDNPGTYLIKPGDPGTESLFYEIKIASDGIIIWQQPRGEFDAPDKGDLRWYPDENGFIYESLIDDNAFSPEAYPAGWKQL